MCCRQNQCSQMVSRSRRLIQKDTNFGPSSAQVWCNLIRQLFVYTIILLSSIIALNIIKAQVRHNSAQLNGTSYCFFHGIIDRLPADSESVPPPLDIPADVREDAGRYSILFRPRF